MKVHLKIISGILVFLLIWLLFLYGFRLAYVIAHTEHISHIKIQNDFLIKLTNSGEVCSGGMQDIAKQKIKMNQLYIQMIEQDLENYTVVNMAHSPVETISEILKRKK